MTSSRCKIKRVNDAQFVYFLFVSLSPFLLIPQPFFFSLSHSPPLLFFLPLPFPSPLLSSPPLPSFICRTTRNAITDIDRIIRDKRIFFFLFCRAFKFCLSLSLSLSWLLRLLSFYLFSNLEWNFLEFNSNFFRLNFFFYFENADNDDDLLES